MSLDPLTLSPAVGLVALQFFLYAGGWALGAWLLREQRAVLAHWAGFMACVALGFLLMSLRGEPRTWMAFNGAALAWIAGLLLLWRGVARYFRAPAWGWAQALVFVVLLLGNLWLGPGAEGAAARVVLSYGSGMLVFVLLVANVVPVTAYRFGPARSLVLLVPAIIVVIAFALLVIRQLSDPGHAFELHRSDPRNLRALAAYVVAAALFNVTFTALVVARLVHRLRELSVRDTLTGLYNRRAMDERLRQQCERWRRGGERFSIALLDLDFFKRINDTLGHQAGDKVLLRTGQWLQAEVRGGDMVARVGGEEFLVLMPGASGAESRVLAERLRMGLAALHRQALAAGEATAPTLTVSIGVAEVQEGDGGPDGLIRRADEALYRAKALGRDRVELAG